MTSQVLFVKTTLNTDGDAQSEKTKNYENGLTKQLIRRDMPFVTNPSTISIVLNDQRKGEEINYEKCIYLPISVKLIKLLIKY